MKLTLLTTKELRAKKPAEIASYVTKLQLAQAQLTHDLQLGKTKQTHQLASYKRSLARAYTVLQTLNFEEEK